MENLYDVLIAGGGMSGVLAASQLLEKHKEWKIGIIDKETRLGGRLAALNPEYGSWGYGLNRISSDLYDYFDHSLKQCTDNEGLSAFTTKKDSRFGVISAGKMSETSIDKVFTDNGGVRAIGGAAAQRDWALVSALMEAAKNEKKADLPVSQVFSGTRKSPAAIVLAHLARFWGVSDLWTVSVSTLKAKAEEFDASTICGHWEQALEALMTTYQSSERAHVHLASLISDARLEGDIWHLKTTTGNLSAKRLLVAQSPWEASLWLPRPHWPSKLIGLINRVKPTSTVVLVGKRQDNEQFELPERLLIPAENVQVLVDPQAICFQATIPYELRLQAPEVVKAIKRLKRGRKKLLASFDGLSLEGEHIALQPVGWGAPLGTSDRKLMKRFKLAECQNMHLGFCGDMYGDSVQGDQNIMASISTVVDALQ
jgi:glycine/D-amino acid oxidase-like deaminating enzyme